MDYLIVVCEELIEYMKTYFVCLGFSTGVAKNHFPPLWVLIVYANDCHCNTSNFKSNHNSITDNNTSGRTHVDLEASFGSSCHSAPPDDP